MNKFTPLFVLSAMALASTAHAQTTRCLDFTGEAGNRSNGTTFVYPLPPGAPTLQVYDVVHLSFTIEDNGSLGVSEGIFIERDGSSAGTADVQLYMNWSGSSITKVTFTLYAYSGTDVNVSAYSDVSGTTQIGSTQTYNSDGDVEVTFNAPSGSSIARIDITGGDNEEYADDFCFTIP